MQNQENEHIQAGINATFVAFERVRDKIFINAGEYHTIDTITLAVVDFGDEAPNAFASFDSSGMAWCFVSLKLIKEILGLDSTEGQRLEPLIAVLIHELVHSSSRVDVFFLNSLIASTTIVSLSGILLWLLPFVWWPLIMALGAVLMSTVKSAICNFAELEADYIAAMYVNPTFLPTVLSQINRYNDSHDDEEMRNNLGCGMLLFGDHPTTRFRKAQSRLAYLNKKGNPFILRVYRPDPVQDDINEAEHDNKVMEKAFQDGDVFVNNEEVSNEQ
jgi:Zn-dependent protease with chaperone function